MNRLGALILRLGLGLSLVACAGGDPLGGVESEEAQEPIVGGTDDTGDPAVVAIFISDPGATSGGLCSGTLISRTWVVTAAHCVDPAVAGENKEYKVIFNPTLRGAPAETVWPVKRVVWDTAFDANQLPNGHDIGLIELARAAPANITPVPWVKSTIPASAMGGDIRLVGYGLNNGFDQQGESAGIKRQITVTLNTIGEKMLEVGKFGATSCNGDSGGPAFVKINGVETLVGITSYGMVFCIAQGFYTRVDLYLPFINQYVTDSGPGCTPQCSGRECGTDGCGGTCPGKCEDNETCSPGGQCVPKGPNGCPHESEQNDDAAHAGPFCAGDAIDGTISSNTDNDWFVIDVPAGTTYTFLLDEVSDKHTLSVYKKSTKTGDLMHVGDGKLAGEALVLSRRTSSGGQYYVQVKGAGVSASDVYSLFLVK